MTVRESQFLDTRRGHRYTEGMMFPIKILEAEVKEELRTVTQASETLDVSRQTIYNWIDQGRFPNAFTVGDGEMVLIPASDVENVRKEEAEKLITKLGRLGFRAEPA